MTSGAPCALPSAAAALVPTSYFASCGPPVWSVDPNLPVTWVRTLEEDIYKLTEARTTFALVTLAVAACAALALGIVGLYGVCRMP